MNKARFQELYRMHRVARRHMLADGAIDMVFSTVNTLRAETGRFLSFPNMGYRHGVCSAERMWTSRGSMIYKLAGPYLCGRRGALSR